MADHKKHVLSKVVKNIIFQNKTLLVHEDKHRLNSPTEGILTTAKVFTYLNLPQNAMKPLFCPQIVGKFRETFQRAYSLPPITTKNDEFDAKSWVPDLIEAPSRFT